MGAREIKWRDLGRKMYYADGEVELTDEEVAYIKQHVEGWSVVSREANTFYTIPLLSPTTLAVQSQAQSFKVNVGGEYLTGTQQNPYKTRAIITITPTDSISYQNCYFELNRFGETPNQEMVTLVWNVARTSATCSLVDTYKSLQSTPYFNISSSNTYTITINGLDPNASYDGYLHSGNLSKRFSIMEVIQQ